jgi:energy-coupling factor transporter ATP-binding protein EcfA2
VPPGSVFALLGPNGAGKTTTVHILTTLIRPDAGEVQVAGRDAIDGSWPTARPSSSSAVFPAATSRCVSPIHAAGGLCDAVRCGMTRRSPRHPWLRRLAEGRPER